MGLIKKETIIEKIKEKDTDFFYGLYNNELNGEYLKEINNEVKVVYDQHYGDGNEWTRKF